VVLRMRASLRRVASVATLITDREIR